jgi:catechol 2,3-dioxygenase-like lactoylglutathione lyase family enzyme
MPWAAGEVPKMLDHILLGCRDLDQGIAFVEEHTGVRAAIGGVHPGRGTRNALLSLGERRYLEIIAPDPAQENVPPVAAKRVSELKHLKWPHLMGWAAHVSDIDAAARKLKDSGFQVDEPRAGSRKRPDGRILNWKSLDVEDDRRLLIPFFIEWSADSIHPSVDAPKGCRLESFEAADPNRRELSETFRRLGIDVPVHYGDKAELRAQIVGPKGKLDVTS